MSSTEEKMVQVRALELGFYQGARQRKGSVFLVPEGTEGSWFIPANATAADIAAHAAKRAARARERIAEGIARSHAKIDSLAAKQKQRTDKFAEDAARHVELDAERQKKRLLGTHNPGYGQSPKALEKAVAKKGGAPVKPQGKQVPASGKGRAKHDDMV